MQDSFVFFVVIESLPLKMYVPIRKQCVGANCNDILRLLSILLSVSSGTRNKDVSPKKGKASSRSARNLGAFMATITADFLLMVLPVLLCFTVSVPEELSDIVFLFPLFLFCYFIEYLFEFISSIEMRKDCAFHLVLSL